MEMNTAMSQCPRLELEGTVPLAFLASNRCRLSIDRLTIKVLIAHTTRRAELSNLDSPACVSVRRWHLTWKQSRYHL
jgi:hypothetical protein